MTLQELLLVASGLTSTTYGFGEGFCGDVGKPRRCEYGAITASGEIFDPSLPSAAIAAPFTFRLTARTVYLKVPGGQCHPIRLTDKMNPRYMGQRGFDLSPAAVALLTNTEEPSRTWSGKVEVCYLTAEDKK